MRDRICRIDENLLQRTAGPYIRVRIDKTQCEYNESASLPTPDVSLRYRERSKRANSGYRHPLPHRCSAEVACYSSCQRTCRILFVFQGSVGAIGRRAFPNLS
jgi:hypothetical protein